MTNLPPSRTSPKMMLRIPAGLKDHIAELARANGRSLNAQVIALIEIAIEQESLTEELDRRVDKLEYQVSEILARLGLET